MCSTNVDYLILKQHMLTLFEAAPSSSEMKERPSTTLLGTCIVIDAPFEQFLISE